MARRCAWSARRNMRGSSTRLSPGCARRPRRAPVSTLTIGAQDADPDPQGALPLAEGPLPEGP